MLFRVVLVICLGVFSTQSFAAGGVVLGGGSTLGGTAASVSDLSSSFYTPDIGSSGAGAAGSTVGSCGYGVALPAGTVKVTSECVAEGQGSCTVYVKNLNRLEVKYKPC